MNVGVEIQIYGKVQGVWFRGSTQRKARALGLKGWVQNEADGSVRLRAFGPQENLTIFEEWCKKGPPHAEVISLQKEEIPFESHADFKINR